MPPSNKALIRRAVEDLWNRGDIAVVDELVAGDDVSHQPGGETRGREGVRQRDTARRASFPDIVFTIDDQIAAADRSVIRWTARATQLGPFNDVPATGRSGVVTGVTIHRVANNMVVEGWTIVDGLGLPRQLGAIPEPAPAT